MFLKSRALQDEDDYLRIHDLIIENYKTSPLRLYPSIGDIDYWRYAYEKNPECIESIHLWEKNNGKLVGFAWPGGEHTDIVSSVSNRNVENEMLAWAEELRLSQQIDTSRAFFHKTGAFDCDHARETIMQKRGYRKTSTFAYYGRCSLDSLTPEPCLSQRYTIRSIQGLKEVEERASLNHIAGNSVTKEQYLRLMREAPTYIQDLDLVCVTDCGQIVAFCTVWFDQVNGVGVFEPYGCHPEHRRRGNARCLLWEGMKRLKERGATEVFVSHAGLDSDVNDAALNLNASMGFVSVARNYTWEKQLGTINA